MSPVPGGKSTTRTSSSPQSPASIIWVIADAAIGPRQITALSAAVIIPIDSALMPNACAGISRLPSS